MLVSVLLSCKYKPNPNQTQQFCLSSQEATLSLQEKRRDLSNTFFADALLITLVGGLTRASVRTEPPTAAKGKGLSVCLPVTHKASAQRDGGERKRGEKRLRPFI